MASKLYGVNATIIISVFVFYCICINIKKDFEFFELFHNQQLSYRNYISFFYLFQTSESTMNILPTFSLSFNNRLNSFSNTTVVILL